MQFYFSYKLVFLILKFLLEREKKTYWIRFFFPTIRNIQKVSWILGLKDQRAGLAAFGENFYFSQSTVSSSKLPSAHRKLRPNQLQSSVRKPPRCQNTWLNEAFLCTSWITLLFTVAFSNTHTHTHTQNLRYPPHSQVPALPYGWNHLCFELKLLSSLPLPVAVPADSRSGDEDYLYQHACECPRLGRTGLAGWKCRSGVLLSPLMKSLYCVDECESWLI